MKDEGLWIRHWGLGLIKGLGFRAVQRVWASESVV